METHDSTPIPPSEAADAKPGGSAGSASVAGRPVSGRSGAVRLWALGAGAGAALVSWLLIEATLDSFKPKGTATRFMGSTFIIPGWQERATAGTRNAVLALGLMGATMGLALGLAGGLAPVRPSGRRGGVSGPGAGCDRGSRNCDGRSPARVPCPRSGPREHVRRDGRVPAGAWPSLGRCRRCERAGFRDRTWRSRPGRSWTGGRPARCRGRGVRVRNYRRAGISRQQDHRAHRRDMGHPLARTVPGRHPARSRGCRTRSLST